MHIPEDIYQKIEATIASEKSVVGIDAKKTHILILHQLMELNQRIENLEKLVEKIGSSQ